MSTFAFADSPATIRPEYSAAYSRYWQQLASPGSWWTGAERVAIAAEARNALSCDFCRQRKQALSPYNFEGEHSGGDSLPPRAVDAVHRIITDQSRITRTYIDGGPAEDLSVERYVELLGVVVCVFSIDEHMRALGLPLEPLPEPIAGEISEYRPPGLEHDTAYVPMIESNAVAGNEADLWKPGQTANVIRALSLVPNALREWSGIGDVQYLDPKSIMDVGRDTGRAINRMQIELVAGRVSSHNECFY